MKCKRSTKAWPPKHPNAGPAVRVCAGPFALTRAGPLVATHFPCSNVAFPRHRLCCLREHLALCLSPIARKSIVCPQVAVVVAAGVARSKGAGFGPMATTWTSRSGITGHRASLSLSMTCTPASKNVRTGPPPLPCFHAVASPVILTCVSSVEQRLKALWSLSRVCMKR